MQQTEGLRRALAADLGQGSAAWAMQRFAERLPAEFPAFGLEPRRDLEFKWADYLRAHWAQTGISTKDIDTNFDSATNAALRLAAQKDAAGLPGYTGKMSCD